MKEPISSEKPVAVTSDGFSRQIIRRHTGFGLSVQKFHPLISTGGIIPLLGRWIELIYAIPFLSIRREITTQRIESMAGKINQPTSLILNFLLNFSEQQPVSQPRSRLIDETLKKLAISLQRSYFFQSGTAFTLPVTSLFSTSRAIIQLYQERERRYASRDQKQVSTYTQSILKETKQPITERTEETSPEENRQRLLESTMPLLLTVRYNPMLLSYQMPTIIHIARESAISAASRQMEESLVAARLITVPPVAPLPTIKTERQETPGYTELISQRVDSETSRQPSSLTTAPAPIRGVEPIQRESAEGSRLNVLNLTKIEPTYRTYPVMETTISRENPQIIRETQVIEKEVATRQPPPPKIDIERLTEEVYRLFERRVRIERERRGL